MLCSRGVGIKNDFLQFLIFISICIHNSKNFPVLAGILHQRIKCCSKCKKGNEMQFLALGSLKEIAKMHFLLEQVFDDRQLQVRALRKNSFRTLGLRFSDVGLSKVQKRKNYILNFSGFQRPQELKVQSETILFSKLCETNVAQIIFVISISFIFCMFLLSRFQHRFHFILFKIIIIMCSD